MQVLLLIIVLVVLILVHELGHFIVAKLSGMRVDEFGIGYPPRALTLWKYGETEYTLNWLPFGGFVKIYGEDGLEESTVNSQQSTEIQKKKGRAFSDKNRFLQALVLIAGIAMNMLFAWLLISGSLLAGTPRALDANEIANAKDAAVTISDVLPDSPAADAGMKAGDTLIRAITPSETFTSPDAEAFTAFIAKDTNSTPITFDLRRGGNRKMPRLRQA